jgi:dipeptidyl aminopeptidase/acylaminoacyl peptidase
VPVAAASQPTPLLVFLHSWSGDFRQDNSPWHREAVSRGWIYLHPNFRGANVRPAACGSKLARQDVGDAIGYVCSRFAVDPRRVYLAGASGGGHMALRLAADRPQRFAAVSAWVAITDLVEWHRFHSPGGRPRRYAQNLEACCGGPPGSSSAVDAEYRDRSPIHHLDRVGALPIELAAGIDDGHTGSVPVDHSLRAFNVVARAGGFPVVSDATIDLLLKRQYPMPQQPVDAEFGRRIVFRQQAGAARITIFEGGHEGLPHAACKWLARQRRPTKP